MLSFRAWISLLLFYLLYLLVGGFVFQALEAPTDCDSIHANYNKSKYLHQLIDGIKDDNLTSIQERNLDYLLKEITDLFMLNDVGVQVENLGQPPNCTHHEMKWNFYNSLFFSFTAITTIGYGHLSPDTPLGKIICMIYSLLGVPINGIFIGSLGAYFRNKLKRFISEKQEKHENDLTYFVVLVFQVMVYLVFGLVLFIFLPAIIISNIEKDWNYLDSVYFAFITLTTIGFGDLVTGNNQDTLNAIGYWEYVYLAGVFIWIVFGLGYIFMIIGIIADGIKEPAKKAVKKLAQAEKVILSKVLQEIVDIKEGKQNENQMSVAEENGNFQNFQSISATKGLKNDGSNLTPNHNNTTNNFPQSNKVTEVHVQEMIEELNDSTITSLHKFVESAHYVKNRVSDSAPKLHRSRLRTPQVFSRSSSFNEVEKEPRVSNQEAMVLEGDSEVQRNNAWSFVQKLNLRSFVSARDTSDSKADSDGTFIEKLASKSKKTSVSLPEILRQTTLEEFLQAIDRVKASNILTEDFSDSSENNDSDLSVMKETTLETGV